MGTFFVFIILRVIPVYTILKHSFVIPELGAQRKIDIFIDYTLISFTQAAFNEQIIVLILSLLTAINILFFVVFARRQQKILSQKSFIASLSGMFLGIFGVGCLSCGVLILAPFLSFIGLGAYLGNFARYAVSLSYAGIFLIIFSILYLLKKISEPLVCD